MNNYAYSPQYYPAMGGWLQTPMGPVFNLPQQGGMGYGGQYGTGGNPYATPYASPYTNPYGGGAGYGIPPQQPQLIAIPVPMNTPQGNPNTTGGQTTASPLPTDLRKSLGEKYGISEAQFANTGGRNLKEYLTNLGVSEEDQALIIQELMAQPQERDGCQGTQSSQEATGTSQTPSCQGGGCETGTAGNGSGAEPQTPQARLQTAQDALAKAIGEEARLQAQQGFAKENTGSEGALNESLQRYEEAYNAAQTQADADRSAYESHKHELSLAQSDAKTASTPEAKTDAQETLRSTEAEHQQLATVAQESAQQASVAKAELQRAKQAVAESERSQETLATAQERAKKARETAEAEVAKQRDALLTDAERQKAVHSRSWLDDLFQRSPAEASSSPAAAAP